MSLSDASAGLVKAGSPTERNYTRNKGYERNIKEGYQLLYSQLFLLATTLATESYLGGKPHMHQVGKTLLK